MKNNSRHIAPLTPAEQAAVTTLLMRKIGLVGMAGDNKPLPEGEEEILEIDITIKESA
jgi:hypothetical protein